jgi:hypothetical protein
MPLSSFVRFASGAIQVSNTLQGEILSPFDYLPIAIALGVCTFFHQRFFGCLNDRGGIVDTAVSTLAQQMPR